MIKAILLSVGGSVLNTDELETEAWKMAIADSGRRLPKTFIDYCVGLSEKSTQTFFERYLGESNFYQSANALAKQHYNNLKQRIGIKTRPGFEQLHAFLKSNNMKLIGVSSTEKGKLSEELSLAGISDVFNGIVYADDVDAWKPFPQPYRAAIQESGFENNECLAVENTHNGVLSAYNACVHSVYLPNVTDVHAEVRALTEKTVADFGELIAFIQEVNAA